jgi:hypothetical protein
LKPVCPRECSTFSTLRANLYECISALFVLAPRPVLLRDLKRLIEPVREQRAAICLEALYSLPLAIKILQRVADNLDDRLVVTAFSPILQSVRLWLIAKRLSINYRINPWL